MASDIPTYNNFIRQKIAKAIKRALDEDGNEYMDIDIDYKVPVEIIEELVAKGYTVKHLVRCDGEYPRHERFVEYSENCACCEDCGHSMYPVEEEGITIVGL